MPDLTATVAAIYAAFGRGDVPAILDHLADDVQWEHWSEWTPHAAGVPWLRARDGKAGAAEFFQVIGAWTIPDFRVHDLLTSGRQVAAEVTIEARLPSGATFRDEELHLWTFDEGGKVSRFRHYVDTAKHIAASRDG
jgi:ketosteroid isomerase-like protein